MALNPDWMPYDDEDQRRKAAIEEMMRSQREFYFRNEPVQQEYRDIVDRLARRQEDVETPRVVRTPGPFDLAVGEFLQKRAGQGSNTGAAAKPSPQVASLAIASGVNYPDDSVGDTEDRDSSDGILNRAAEALRPYRVAQTGAPTSNTYPSSDASDTSWMFDGGKAEAESIFRRNGEVPNGAAKGDRLPVPRPASEGPDAGGGKGDRLPVFRPEVPQSPPAFDARRYGVGMGRADDDTGRPVGRRDDPLKAFEVDTPLRFDGENRVEQLQRRPAIVRKLPIKQELEDKINYAAQKNGVGIEVHSGGQVPFAKSRFEETGIKDRIGKPTAIRHDDGDAADVDLYVIDNGKRRYLDSKNPNDKKIMESFIRDVVAAGATGIGHGYMDVGGSKTRRIHVGGGKPLAWLDPNNSLTLQLEMNRQDARTSNLPFVWLEVARLEGVATREKLLKEGAWPKPTAPLKFMRP